MQSQNPVHPAPRRFARLHSIGLRMLLLLCGVAFPTAQPIAAQSESRLFIELVGSIDMPNGASDVQVVGEYAYVGSRNNLNIVDISDPATPILTNSIDKGSKAFHVVGDYAYLVGGNEHRDLQIIDIHDLANPTLTGSIQLPSIPNDIQVVGNYAYIADHIGLQIVDISNPTNPVITSEFNTPFVVWNLHTLDGYVYLADQERGLYILDVTDPTAPALASHNTRFLTSVYVVGSYAYLGSTEFLITDVSDPWNPTSVSSYDVGAEDIPKVSYVDDNFAYLNVSGGSDIYIVDVRHPTTPTLAGSYSTPGQPLDIHVRNNYVYVADSRAGLLILRITCAGSDGAAQGRERCFEETGYCVQDPILAYWEQNGGLPVFGYPISERRTEQVEDQTLPVQWFERDRLEDHGPIGVLAGRLGARLLELQGRPWETLPTVDAAAEGCRYFGETRHMICEPFLSYWEQNGGLERFGYPITEAQEETLDDWTGTVQYFERRRLEHHPEHAGTAYEVLLGLLGVEVSSHTPTAEPDQLSGRIAFSSVRDSNADIWVINADGSNLTNLTNTPDINESHPAWSPDGTQIAYELDNKIWVMNDDGTNQRQLTTTAEGNYPTWSPDGTQIAYSASGNILVIDAAGTGTPVELIPGDGDVFTGSITWSPDGTWIAFSSSDAQFGGYPILVALNVDSGELYILTDSHGLLTVEEYNTMDRGEIELPADQPMYSPDWSPDGNQIAFGTHSGSGHSWPNIWVAQWDGRESRRITSFSWRTDPQAFEPTWSPDGRRIAFVTHELYTPEGHLKSPASSSLRIINADGSSMTTIRESVGYIQEPDWGPE